MDWQTFNYTWGFNPAFWAGSFIGVAGLLLTFWMRSRSALAYDFHHSTIISRAGELFAHKIKISYEGIDIPKATFSTISVWNDGTKTIRRSDITTLKPLVFRLPDGQTILQCTVYSAADESMDVKFIQNEAQRVFLSFEYIEPRQGFILEILHTGEQDDLFFEGVLIEAKTPIRRPRPVAGDWFTTVTTVVMFVLAGPIFTAQLYYMIKPLVWTMPTFVVLGMSSVLSLIMFFVGLKKLYNGLFRSRLNFGKAVVVAHSWGSIIS